MRISSVFVACLVVISALPAPATAYPAAITAFEDGSTGAWANLTHPPRARLAGTLLVGSNATVTGSSIELAGSALDLDMNFTHDFANGFPDGTFSGGALRTPPGISLRLANGSTEFSGVALDFGTYNGTIRTADGVVLTGPAGTYLSPEIGWNGVSYGRLIANVTRPRSPAFGGYELRFSVEDPDGNELQAGVGPGQLITVNGTLEPTVRIRVSMAAAILSNSPKLSLVGAGFVLADYGLAAGATEDGATRFAEGIELNQSYYDFTEYAGNPILNTPTGSWYSHGIEASAAVTVGDEIWLYGHGVANNGSGAIGRMISADGGRNWTIDANPIFYPTASAWDSSFVGEPFVIWDGTGYKMWYMGSSSGDAHSVGYATSTDGVNWTKYVGNPVLRPSSSGWDSYNVGWPHVLLAGSTYYLYFAGRSPTDARRSIGVATSSDGTSWTKSNSNPLISWGSTNWGAYDVGPGDVQFVDGVFFLYWVCSPGPSDYDGCLSTSTDGVSFTHYSKNPILTTGDGAWDSLTAAVMNRVTNPLDGRAVVFFIGNNAGAYKSIGRADPQRTTPGTYSAVWDLGAEVPHAFLRYELGISLPAQTSAAPSVAVWDGTGDWGPPESVQITDASVLTAPQRWLRHNVTLSTSNPLFTPTLHSTRIAYDRYDPAGSFESAVIAAPHPISNATLTLSMNVPSRTQVTMWVSNDGGASWITAVSGERADFAAPGVSFRYRLDIVGTTALSPSIAKVTGKLGVDSRPNDVTVRGADGTLIAQVAGELGAPVTVPLDPAYFNSRIAPLASSVPPIPVPFEFWVNASTAGAIHIDAIRLDLTFPDELRVYFAPETPLLLLEQGEAQFFRAVASTTPGVAIQYSWWFDGAPAASAGENFTFSAGPGTLGNHTVLASVTNGQFTMNMTWNLRVVDKPVYLVAKFYPAITEVEVPVGLLQQFYAAVANSTYPATITWTLDGQAVAAVPLFDYHAPSVPGRHTLHVEVTNGFDSLSWTWNITVTDVPGAVSHQLAVTFTPAGDVELSINQTAVLAGEIAGSAPPDISWEWTLDGKPVGTNSSRLEMRGTLELLGEHRVSLLVHNSTAVAARGWNVSIVLPPASRVFIVSPTEGTQVSTRRVQVHGTASPDTTVSVGDLPAQVAADGSFAVDVVLLPGTNQIVAYASDAFGRVSTATVNVTYTPPAGSAPTAYEEPNWFWLVLIILVGACVALAYAYLRARRGDENR